MKLCIPWATSPWNFIVGIKIEKLIIAFPQLIIIKNYTTYNRRVTWTSYCVTSQRNNPISHFRLRIFTFARLCFWTNPERLKLYLIDRYSFYFEITLAVSIISNYISPVSICEYMYTALIMQLDQKAAPNYPTLCVLAKFTRLKSNYTVWSGQLQTFA